MSVVFTDSFTVGADVDIASYPATPDYAYNVGSANQLKVIAATDSAYTVTNNSDVMARIIDGTVPTGDQQITADCYAVDSADWDNGYLGVRCKADATQNYYFGQLIFAEANEVQIYKALPAGFTQVATRNNALAGSGVYSYRLKVTGVGATVSVEFQIGASTTLTYDDTSATRHVAGPPGIGGYSYAGNTVYVDNVSVDDLAAGGGAVFRSLSLLGVGI